MNRLVPKLAWTLLAGRLVAGADGHADEPFEPFLNKHCVRCHGPEKVERDLRIDRLSRDFRTGGDGHLWVEIVERINAGEMPPEEEPQPTEDEIAAVVGQLDSRIREGRASRMAARPPVAHYRLSRKEYQNTVYDLLGVRYDPAKPGELNADTLWQGDDIDWANDCIRVHSTKTEHHENEGERIVPLFPELRQELTVLWEHPESGPVYVLPNIRHTTNVLPTLIRIINRAGLTVGPKPWQNMRASRATELENEFGAHKATQWCGHTEKIAEAHYWMVTEDDITKAATYVSDAHMMQQVDASPGNASKTTLEPDSANEKKPAFAGVCEESREDADPQNRATAPSSDRPHCPLTTPADISARS